MSLESDYKERLEYLDAYNKNPVRLVEDSMSLAETVSLDVNKCLEESNKHLGDQTWQRLVIRRHFPL